MNRYCLVWMLASMLSATAYGQTVIVDEDFESYADDAAMHAVWPGNPGTGTIPATEDTFDLTTAPAGISADFNGDNFVDAADYVTWRKNAGTMAEYDAWTEQFGGPPGGGGPENTYVFHEANTIGGNLQYAPDLDPNFIDGSIFPSQGLEPIVLRADIFTPTSVIQRNTIGLRSNAPANIFEMGVYNDGNSAPDANPPGTTGAATNGNEEPPAVPQNKAFASFGIRAVLFANQSDANPNWQFFAMDPLWDTNANGLVTAFEAFAALGIAESGGWHTLEATFEPLEGGNSGDITLTVTLDLLRDGLNNAQGTEGVDGTITVTNLNVQQQGFDSLRIGGPSQLSSTQPAGFDNILLTGPLVAVGSGGVAVPEPSAIGLALFAVAGLFVAGRKHRA
jgi:hypothetical protein